MTDDPRDATEVLADASDLYERKNSDYGDSWKLAGKTMALWLEHQGVEELTIPTDPEQLNSFGLFTRRLDKMIREFNGWFVTDELQVDEAIAETHEDDVPYSAMHTELAEQSAASSGSEHPFEFQKLDWVELNGQWRQIEEIEVERHTGEKPTVYLTFFGDNVQNVHGTPEQLRENITNWCER